MMLDQTFDLKWVSCSACGADDFRWLRKVGEWNIGRCSQCSLVYLNPMPFKKVCRTDPFSDYYYTKFQFEVTQAKLEFERQQFLSQVAEYSKTTECSARRKFLDMGCGPGLSVRAAVQCDWEAVGIDVDKQLVEIGRHQLGVELRCGDINECKFDENEFDFVRLKSVLQFLSNPFDVLIQVRRILAPGGFVLIIVPNEDGLPNLFKRMLSKKTENRFGTLVLPYHVHAFTPSALECLLKRTELRLLKIGTTTPFDPQYALIDQLKDETIGRRGRSLIWRLSKAVHRGSVLFAYAQKT